MLNTVVRFDQVPSLALSGCPAPVYANQRIEIRCYQMGRSEAELTTFTTMEDHFMMRTDLQALPHQQLKVVDETEVLHVLTCRCLSPEWGVKQ